MKVAVALADLEQGRLLQLLLEILIPLQLVQVVRAQQQQA